MATAEAQNDDPSGPSEDLGLSGYPGPVLILADGAARPLNAPGEALAAALVKPFGAAVASVLSELALRAHEVGAAVTEKLSVPGEAEAEAEWLEATLVPRTNGETLVVCRDITLDVNVRTALVESRQRYKDMIEVACDFAWETDVAGCFTFLSADKVFGYPAKTMIGLNPGNYLAQPTVSTSLPFNPSEQVQNEEIWLKSPQGQALCIVVSAMPLYDGLGRRTGTRGVCRDITVQRMRDDILSRSRMRDRVVSFIVDTIRSKERPAEVLSTAAASVGRALESQGCQVFLRGTDGDFAHASSFGIAVGEQHWSQRILDRLEDVGQYEQIDDGLAVLAATTTHNHRNNGTMVLLRASDGAEWSEEDRVLLSALREPVGIALAQITEQQKLEQLSRIDEPTGLLNRRAFNEDLHGRLNRSVRRGRSGALIYVDLDNFKPVNDTYGHKKGDEVLKSIGGILQDSIREYDLAARLGGDEFALWLDDTNARIAHRRGRSIVEACRRLSDYSAKAETPLGVSVGIAVFDPEGEEGFDGLIARADEAMYEAKRNGKGQAAMAPQPDRRS
jgi:diguanylate cyclase (GGDEF)-like protein/PAS domain S-box-containing protein